VPKEKPHTEEESSAFGKNHVVSASGKDHAVRILGKYQCFRQIPRSVNIMKLSVLQHLIHITAGKPSLN
jgi:hypothetical protein